jgi:putative addiction module component (TIGR02574 family)
LWLSDGKAERDTTMTDQTQSILETALTLPETDRLVIAETLLQSVPDDAESLDDAAFAAELDRRWAEFLQNPSVAVPWSEVRRQD